MTWPIKANFKKGDLLKAITSKWLNWVGNFLNDTKWIGLTFTPTSSGTGCKVEVKTDGLTIGFLPDTVTMQVIDGAIGTAQLTDLSVTTDKIDALAVTVAKLAADSVDKTKVAADVAGSGIAQNGDGSLEITPDGSTLELSGDTIQVAALGIDTAQLAAGAATNAKTVGATGSWSLLTPATLNVTNGLIDSVT